MANRYMLDSSAWTEYFAGTKRGSEIRKLIETEKNMTCILSIAELSDKFSREKKRFGRFLSFIKSASLIANLSLSICSEAGRLKTRQRTTKKGFRLADAIIYMAAKENSCVLVTLDRDFSGMEDVMLIE